MKLYYGCFDGLRGLEIAMTREQAESASHQGQCIDDVRALLKCPEIASQLDAFGPEKIREALKEYGAWDEDELRDDEANRERALWSAAGNLTENKPWARCCHCDDTVNDEATDKDPAGNPICGDCLAELWDKE